jgi:3-methyladenine DNA glycosylase AlkD
MTLNQVMAQLEKWGSEKGRELNKRHGARMQETMNFCLGEIGIRHADLRKRCIQIGEKLGVFKDYPTPKGCTSPYGPEWIAAVVGKK